MLHFRSITFNITYSLIRTTAEIPGPALPDENLVPTSTSRLSFERSSPFNSRLTIYLCSNPRHEALGKAEGHPLKHAETYFPKDSQKLCMVNMLPGIPRQGFPQLLAMPRRWTERGTHHVTITLGTTYQKSSTDLTNKT